jgi:hypothetical protein
MKKVLLGLLLFGVLLLAACGKTSLDGTWKGEEKSGKVMWVTFQEDGKTATMKLTEGDEEISKYDAGYSINDAGDQLTFIYGEDDEVVCTLEQDGDTMKISDENGDGTTTYIKQ